MTIKPDFRTFVLLASLLAATATQAAEGYRVRYPLTGTLGGEQLATGGNPGWYGTVVVTRFRADRLAGDDGNDFRTSLPLSLPGLSAMVPVTGYLTQNQTNLNFIAAYATQDDYAGGRFSFGVNLPVIQVERKVRIEGALPNLPPALQPRAALVDSQWQASLRAMGANLSGEVSGLGDAELTVAWLRKTSAWRAILNATLVAPTGSYNVNRAVNTGHGDFYSLRTGALVTWQLTPDTALSLRASGVINSVNQATRYRSGHFVALESSLGHRFPFAVLGLNTVSLNQVTDDNGPGAPVGGGRFRFTGAGPFVMIGSEAQRLAATITYLHPVSSANAITGKSLQVRVSKGF